MSYITDSLKRMARVQSVLNRVNDAIDAAAKAKGINPADYDAMLESGLPPRFSFETIDSMVSNGNDYRRIVGFPGDAAKGRYSRLERALRPNAMEVDDKTGLSTFLKNEAKYAIRLEEKERKKDLEYMESRREKSMADMSGAELASVLVDMDLPVSNPRKLDSAKRIYQKIVSQPAAYRIERLESWLGTWMDPHNLHRVMPGYDSVVKAVEWMRDNRQVESSYLFTAHPYKDELVEDFIYLHPHTPAYAAIPIDDRHNRAVIVIMTEARYLGYE